MKFGIKNAPATRLMSIVTQDLVNCETYIDNVIILYIPMLGKPTLKEWKAFFARFNEANLTINLKKSEIGQAHVTYLLHIVGEGKVSPKLVKGEAILNFQVLSNKRGI